MFKRQYFFILFVLKICTGGIANYNVTGLVCETHPIRMFY